MISIGSSAMSMACRMDSIRGSRPRQALPPKPGSGSWTTTWSYLVDQIGLPDGLKTELTIQLGFDGEIATTSSPPSLA
jgi:hypothetical protein